LFNGNIVREEAHKKVAEFLLIAGGFNVNSTSETAWQHYLASMLSRDLLVMLPGEAPKKLDKEEGKFSISRYPMSIGGVADRATGQEKEDLLWSGSREVTKDQLTELARAIVREVKKRGPFQSMAEFVNRRLDGTNVELALSGALQAALDADEVSINKDMRDIKITNSPIGYKFKQAALGPVKEGIAGYVSQADLLQSLGNTMTVRDDTFRIRAYGESHNAKGEVTARAWCEAVVQRTPEYVDPLNPATAYDDPETAANELTPVNQNFGRRFKIVSFKWLPRQEIQGGSAS
jgi:hypothetical protein